MATGNLTISANVTGSNVGTETFGPLAVVASTAVPTIAQVALVNGSTTVTVPSGTTCCVIAPPNSTGPGAASPNPAYGGTVTLKGVAGDTGVGISNKWPTVLTWDTAPASFVLTATVAGNATVWFM